MSKDNLSTYIREIQDFPKPGISYKDITTLLIDPVATKLMLEALLSEVEGHKIDKVVGIESRGFMFGMMIAQALGVGFVPARKPRKLPSETISVSYELEYGSSALEMHKDAIKEGETVLVHDDLLATGGTASAAVKLIKQLGGNVPLVSFLIELSFLNGKDQIINLDSDIQVSSIIKY